MKYGEIIKRAWRITWRFKALWVLGVFAGISGCQGGGGGGGGSSYSGSSDSEGLRRFQEALSDMGARAQVERVFDQLWPIIIAGVLALIALGLLWSVLSVAARAALVAGVDDAERGMMPQLGALWSRGFSGFWSVVGVGFILQLPVAALAIFVAFAVAGPIVAAVIAGREPGAEIFAPMCGGLAIGVPLLLVVSVVAGLIYPIALRYVVLGGRRALEAVTDGWRFVRARPGDTIIMYLINGALNVAAALVVAIPLVLVMVVAAIAAGGFAALGSLSSAVGPIALAALVVMVIAMVYSAIWGTFTSALWTLFFQEATAAGQPAEFATDPHAGFETPFSPQTPAPPAHVGPPVAWSPVQAPPPPPEHVGPPVAWSPEAPATPPQAPPVAPPQVPPDA